MTASCATTVVESAVAPAPSPVPGRSVQKVEQASDDVHRQSSVENHHTDEPPVVADDSRTAMSAAETAAVADWEQLITGLREDSPRLARRISIEGKLQRQGDRWQLQASETLKGELEQESVKRVIGTWERDHGRLTILVQEVSEARESSQVGEEEHHSTKPEIIQQAEEIFSSKARNRGPVSGQPGSDS